jgi:flagellar motor switch protein FliG
MEAMMNISDEAIRKAAILIAALDTAAADTLLDGMDEALAARVRAACMDLDEVEAAEQQRVIQQFMRGDAPPIEEPTAAARIESLDELDLSSAVSLAEYLAPPPAATLLADTATASSEPTNEFGIPESMSGEELATALAREHAQTIAVVLAHVAPRTAAAALARLAAAQQAEVARRIANLRHVDGEALRELQAGLRETLGDRVGKNSIEQSGFEAMKRIWQEASAGQRTALEQSLRRRDLRLLSDLADAGGPSEYSNPAGEPLAEDKETQTASSPMAHAPSCSMSFDDLAHLDGAGLRRVLERAENRTLLLALAGASSELVDRVYQQLPRREAQRLRQQIEQQGPIALRDVHEAQRRLAALVGKLAAAGEIEIPDTQRFAAAG